MGGRPKKNAGNAPPGGSGGGLPADTTDTQNRLQAISKRLKAIEQEKAALLAEQTALIEKAYAEGQKAPTETVAEALARTSALIKQRRGADLPYNPGHKLRQRQLAAARQRNEG
jgi:hypothetical protein